MKVLNLESKRLYGELLNEFDNFPLHKKGLIMYCKTQKTLDEEIQLAEHANRIGLNDGNRLEVAGSGMPLDSHLGDHSRLFRSYT